MLAKHVHITRLSSHGLHPPARVGHAVRCRHKGLLLLLLLLLLQRPLLQHSRMHLQSAGCLFCAACTGMQAAACRTSEAGNN